MAHAAKASLNQVNRIGGLGHVVYAVMVHAVVQHGVEFLYEAHAALCILPRRQYMMHHLPHFSKFNARDFACCGAALVAHAFAVLLLHEVLCH
jgi:hypothetical protein